MNPHSLVALLALSAALSAAPLVAGCSNNASDGTGAAQDVIAVDSDAALEQQITDAIAGLTSSGGDADPDPFKVVDLQLGRGETMTDDLLLARLLPKFEGVLRDDGGIPGIEGRPIKEGWEQFTTDPDPANWNAADIEELKQIAEKWRRVQALFEAKLTNVKFVDIGYRGGPRGTLETGAVARVFVGQSSTGRIIAIWGIDVWT